MRNIFKLAFPLLVLVFILLFGTASKAATITVNTLVDENNTGASCSLREAITAANNDAAFGGCTAGSGTDSVLFGVTGTINATASLPDVTTSMNIGNNTTTTPTVTVNRSGASNYRLLKIGDAVTVSISGLVFSNGYAFNLQGGAIDSNNNTLTLTNCVFTNNRATFDGGAVRNNGGNMTVTNCTFANNISDEPSGQGGGIKHNGGTMVITGTTFSNNSADAGGGLHVGTGTVSTTVTNSTFYRNSATFGGGIEMREAATYRNCTFTRNVASSVGGVDVLFHAATLINTIISGNLDPNGNPSDVEVGNGGTVNLGASANNLIGRAGATGLTNGANGNIVGVNDPKLVPLGNYGGLTQTAPPSGNSAALNSGTNTGAPATDQRGAPRTNGGGATDIGAVEDDFVVNLTTDVADTTNGDGICDTSASAGSQCTLRAAIQEANAFAGYQIIAFSLSLPATITPGTELPNLASDMLIAGPGPENLQINGSNNKRLFNVNAGARDSIFGLKVANGFDSVSAGGISNAGTLTLERVMVDHCVSGIQGGGLENGGSSTMNVIDSTISFNSTGTDGAGLITFGAVTVSGSTFVGNTATGAGGGIAVANGGAAQGSITVTNSTFSANSAGTTGGGISFDTSASNTITNCTITLNAQVNVGQSGGGLGVPAGTVVLKNTLIANNTKNGGTQSDITGTVSASSSFNLIGTGGAGGLTNGVNSNQVGVADAKLTTLGSYGGLTQTHILSSNSPAVDAGTNTGAPATDQRGSKRPFGANVDIGAVENTVTVTPTTLPAGTVGTNYDQTYSASGESGDFTFSEAGTLPSGISFDGGSANLGGTPTQTGSFPICVIATDTTFGIAGAICHTLTINAQVVHHFVFATISGAKTAGTAFSVTITAQDSSNNTVTGFTGTVGLTTNAGSITPTSTGAFSAGVRTESVTVTQSGTGKTITANDGSGHTGTSNTFTVNPGALHHFGFAALASQTAGTAFNVVITAQDANNNTVTSFASTVGLTTTAGTISPTTSGSFSSGVRTQSVTVTQAGLGKTISANDGGAGHTGTSGTFNVNAGTLHHFAIDPIGTKMSGLAFNITITAQDLNNNTVTGIVSRSDQGWVSGRDGDLPVPEFSGTVTFTTTAGSVTPGTSNAFTNGLLTQSVVVSGSGPAVTISVNDGAGHTATSNAFRVNAPTAAAVTVAGQVRTALGQPVAYARITMTDSAGATRFALTNPFGYYRFDEVGSGRTYVLSVQGKGSVFAPQVLNVSEDLSAVDFTAME